MNSAKEDVKKFIKQQQDLEQEIENIQKFLNQPGSPGLKGPLVDRDGYPLADTQLILAVREARSKYAMVQNDHVAVMKQIEQSLAELHQAAKLEKDKPSPTANVVPATTEKISTPTPISDSISKLLPFAKVNKVTQGSPSDKAGLLEGDLVLQFGTIIKENDKNVNLIAAVGNLVKNCENEFVEVYILRDDIKRQRVTLQPKKWSGPGLLGCHILPYP